jgi:hypothetical protein
MTAFEAPAADRFTIRCIDVLLIPTSLEIGDERELPLWPDDETGIIRVGED